MTTNPIPTVNKERMARTLTEAGVPAHNHEALIEYIFAGRPTGGFLSALLANDLKQTCAQADHINAAAIHKIVGWLWNHAPIACWGSAPKVGEWIMIGGLIGKVEPDHA